uniref:Uncharacterized protein n=1 Tax=Anguilla anguilla TaxID=7936 RepID=A0A0E9TTC5_ANGAN
MNSMFINATLVYYCDKYIFAPMTFYLFTLFQ